MLFGRVRGTAICTMKYPDLNGLKLLVVQPLNKHLEPLGVAAGGSGRGASRTRGPVRDGALS